MEKRLVRPEMFTLLLIIVSVISFSAKPVIDVSVTVFGDEAMGKIAQGIALSEVLDTNKFKITLKEALKTLAEELRLQDLLSTENVVLSKEEKIEGKLAIELSIRDAGYKKRYEEYVTNNISGDYIYYSGKYIRVILGERYKYDYEKKTYVRSEEGSYVKGTDGEFYSYFGNFYSRAPHEEIDYYISYSVSLRLSYRFFEENFDISDNFVDNAVISVVEYTYDPYNNKLMREESPVDKIYEVLSSHISNVIYQRIMNSRKLKGEVENVKFPRVIVNIGSQDGVKNGMILGVNDGKNYIAELIVTRAGGDYSECEITYLRKGSQILTGMSVFEKYSDFVLPFGFSMFYIYNSSGEHFAEFSLLGKSLNIHRETVATFDLGMRYSFVEERFKNLVFSFSKNLLFEPVKLKLLSSIIFDYDLEDETFQPVSRIGLETQIGIFAVKFLTDFTFSSYEIGGGISW
ncbi:MAG: hypothetical protein ACUVQF_04905 [Fervidobacterium sp.]|uniref:hypothetical protein n=1 Tax=Fervidobacterium sp. TaxID=1871331 RepID=UPI00404987FF